MATRHKEFASLYRKVVSMKKRVGERKGDVTMSSVGTIEAPTEADEPQRIAG